MGLNESHVVNATGHILHVITFNNFNFSYQRYNEHRQPPPNKQPITVAGMPGGRAVKVGVIHNRADGRLIYNLFRVSHGATLTIHEVTQDCGVTSYDHVEGVELLKVGASIQASFEIVGESRSDSSSIRSSTRATCATKPI